MKSCIDLANELNVSKQTVFNNAKKLEIELTKQDNTLYVSSADDVEAIKNRILNNKAKSLNVDVSELINNDSSSKQDNDTQDVSNNNNKIELLRQMIDDKNKQIQSLQDDKHDLTSLLKQQQQLLHNQQSLQLQSNDKIKALELELQEVKEDTSKADNVQDTNKIDNFYRDLREDKQESNSTTNKKVGLLSRFFK